MRKWLDSASAAVKCATGEYRSPSQRPAKNLNR
jgi:hypothetical protein